MIPNCKKTIITDNLNSTNSKEALSANQGKILNDKVNDKVSKSGDIMTAALGFDNKNQFAAIEKIRTVEEKDYLIKVGLGVKDKKPSIALELFEPDNLDIPSARIDLTSDSKPSVKFNGEYHKLATIEQKILWRDTDGSYMSSN